MKTLVHLHVEEILLLPGQEWMDAAAAWHLVRVSRGAAYWLGPGRSRSLVEGEVLVIPPAAEGLVRASQINEVLLHGFNFAPDLLCGFLTLTERHYFEQVSGQPPGEVRFLPTTHAAAERFAALAAAAPAARGLALRVQTLNILAAVFDEEIARHRMPASRSTSARHRFLQLITRMPDLELINHTPDQLARLCACSPRHFNRLFHKQFGTSARARQTELRLLKARQLVCGSNGKIIQVALDCGYRNLGLFNSLFKRRFGLTPSECRQKAAKEIGKARSLIAGLALLLLGSTPGLGAEKPDAAPAGAPSTNAPVFAVKGYELQGNTLLPPSITGPLLQPHTGPAVSLDSIRQALADLKMAYHNRGYVTVSVTLPPQRLANGIVTVQVTEGRLAEINVLNNHYFTSNNVMRELPCLHTNLILNALIFQQELDRANANRDRQIYPLLSPGPEPGTTRLDLKIKDRLPLHAHVELNNYSTPNTPELRANHALVYDNLWQLNHQAGAQYSFSPEACKQGSYPFYDSPLIASYSAYYRLPLAGVNGPAREREYALTDFGYDEATRRFRPPAPSGTSELLFFASRSSSDTGQLMQSSTLSPAVVPPAGGLQVRDQLLNRTLNPNEDLGGRFSKPLPPAWGIGSSVSAGLDFKNYRSRSLLTRTFGATLFVPEFGSTGPPFVEFPSPPTSTSQETFASVQYLPLSLSWKASRPDRRGLTSFTLGQSFNWGGLLSGKKDFQAATGSTNTDGTYCVVTAGLTREQKVYGEWGVRLHTDGQWANEPLISNEQFSLGGLAGVRGYRNGAEYGDTGWRVQFEPHTPYRNLALLFDKVPAVGRLYTFVDYGQRYLIDPGARKGSVPMLGAGGGLDLSLGEHADIHLVLGVPLLSTPDRASGRLRAEFSLSAQF